MRERERRVGRVEERRREGGWEREKERAEGGRELSEVGREFENRLDKRPRSHIEVHCGEAQVKHRYCFPKSQSIEGIDRSRVQTSIPGNTIFLTVVRKQSPLDFLRKMKS